MSPTLFKLNPEVSSVSEYVYRMTAVYPVTPEALLKLASTGTDGSMVTAI